MSVRGAVGELNKEIERLTKLRDALSEGIPEAVPAQNAKAAVSRVRTAITASVAAPEKPAPARKRTLSPAGRKRISDAAKARWAAKKSQARRSKAAR